MVTSRRVTMRQNVYQFGKIKSGKTINVYVHRSDPQTAVTKENRWTAETSEKTQQLLLVDR